VDVGFGTTQIKKPRPQPFPVYPSIRHYPETFEKRSISFKIKAHEDFNHSNMVNISRIKIRMQRRDWVKGGVFQRSRPYNSPKAASNTPIIKSTSSQVIHMGGLIRSTLP